MAHNLGHDIHSLRNHLHLSQKSFGTLIGTTAMNVSRYSATNTPCRRTS